jgi:hypothetical protein
VTKENLGFKICSFRMLHTYVEERMTRPLPAAQMGDALRGGGAEAGRVQLLNPQLTHSKKRPGFHALVFKVCLSL